VKKSRLKKETLYEERDEKERAEFDEKLAEIPQETEVVYVDESGVQTQMRRIRGRAKRGVKIPLEIRGKRAKKLNVIAGYSGGKILAETTYAWNTDSEWFLCWFEFSLIPQLSPESVVIMDNASFHNVKLLNIIAEAYGHKIIFLPKYSPDKNPIEHFWGTMKTWLRNYSIFFHSIRSAIQAFFNRK